MHLRSITLMLAAAAVALPSPAPGAVTPEDDIATLRAQGPAGLATILARYDAAPAGAARDQLALAVDAVAAQRYATVSRLYWYTDLAAAQLAAHAQRRPILALRMLGRLDEDLSCANSRLFRATLYANTDVGKLLRDNFVLYWSSERPVPVVTIDFGDGRKIVRTTTGNSAHYVLDESGDVVDVLPGLYAPSVFAAELRKSLAVARRVRGLDPNARAAQVAAYQREAAAKATAVFARTSGSSYVAGRRRLVGPGDVPSALTRAQRGTATKMAMEVPDLRKIGFDAAAIDTADIAQWATVGQLAFGIKGRVLDARSRALVTALHDGGQATAASPAELDAMIARLEQTIVADTALDEFRLRQQIRGLVASGQHDFATLNGMIYATVFATPKADPWLGLLPRTDFTGLPGDGVVIP
jgi:hypothetical protein